LIGKIWNNKASSGNPYEKIVLYLLTNSPIEVIIEKTCPSLSEKYIFDLSLLFGDYEGGIFILNKTTELGNGCSGEFKYNNSFKNKDVVDFDHSDIKEIFQLWIDKVTKYLDNAINLDLTRIMSILYRYIQWGNAIGESNAEKLSNCLTSFFKNCAVNQENKMHLIEILNEECKKYRFHKGGVSPIMILFNRNSTLINLIKDLSKSKNIEHFLNDIVNDSAG